MPNAWYREKIKTLYSPEQIQARVRELGAEITRDYRGKPLVLLCVLKGSFMFAADLARCIDLPLRVEFLGVQSYGDDTMSSGVVQITLDLARPVDGEEVLIVEDIVDTGLTLDYLVHQVQTRGPASVKVCALLHKPARTKKKVSIDYLGFTIDDVFVVGYGLDWAQKYRNMPEIGVVVAPNDG
ncbi:MAG: hypoxanthine phosphoribosyltransferase [Polyangiaceae bacterium]|nr:hypoxanthine phosphoribosyltransferase [Polyangiaceae bacterium]MCE7892380.1 hypoxanthine phosphoribosyltransferase [Sorangiineae bacterium PRO1]MCL4752956.1 hypoxanthine phosphoribosyltransferase [Myxococcales bacterium]